MLGITDESQLLLHCFWPGPLVFRSIISARIIVGRPTTRTAGGPCRLATEPLSLLTQARVRDSWCEHATSRLPEAGGRRGDAPGVPPSDVHVQPGTIGTTGRSEAGARRRRGIIG